MPYFIVWIFLNSLFVKTSCLLTVYHNLTSYSKSLAHLWNFITFLKLYLGKQPTCWVRAYAAKAAFHLLPLVHWYMGSECTYLGFSQRVTLLSNKLMSSGKKLLCWLKFTMTFYTVFTRVWTVPPHFCLFPAQLTQIFNWTRWQIKITELQTQKMFSSPLDVTCPFCFTR